jgi:hypothetical protein
MQAWPDMPMVAPMAFRTAEARSASAKTGRADLPPSSRPTGVMFSAAPIRTFLPVAPLPVTCSLSTPGCRDSASPPSGPAGVTFMTPGGMPASSASSPSRRQV